MASLSVMTCRLPWSAKLTPGCAPAAWYAIAPATTAAAIATPPIPNQSARVPRPLASPALASVLRVSIVCSRVGTHGGSVWESNPPPTCLEPDAGFEVREAHRDPRRFRATDHSRIESGVYHPRRPAGDERDRLAIDEVAGGNPDRGPPRHRPPLRRRRDAAASPRSIGGRERLHRASLGQTDPAPGDAAAQLHADRALDPARGLWGLPLCAIRRLADLAAREEHGPGRHGAARGDGSDRATYRPLVRALPLPRRRATAGDRGRRAARRQSRLQCEPAGPRHHLRELSRAEARALRSASPRRIHDQPRFSRPAPPRGRHAHLRLPPGGILCRLSSVRRGRARLE